MRHHLLFLSGLMVCAGLGRPASAADPIRITIDQVRIGFTAEGDTTGATRFKIGAWTPIRVDVTNGPQVVSQNDYELITETTDGDDMPYQFPEHSRLPTLQPDEQITLMTFVKPGSSSSEITVSIRSSDGKSTFAKANARRETVVALPSNSYVCLAAGSKLMGLHNGVNRKPGNLGSTGDEANSPNEESPTKVVNAETVDLLPSRWFGYAGVDLVILTSGSEHFISELAADRTGRKEALAEWVRRGGRLIISVGRNHQYVNSLITAVDLLKCPIEGNLSRPQVVLEGHSEALPRDPGILKSKTIRDKAPQPVELAILKPQAGVDVLMSAKTPDAPNEKMPVVVQSSCGVGRVVVVAFDLDLPPFTNWDGQDRFWTALCQDFGIRFTVSNPQNQMKGYSSADDKKELAAIMADNLDAFEDVPVVSFGWVALFILIYIIIVGPLDYLFLKKVVKRLEWTWITFPTLVLAISAGAYFLAYYLKGNDLRINKVDIVDIDLAQSRVYGSTWFTIFSPRIQNYTVGLEPDQTAWSVPPGSQSNPFGVLVSAFDRPETPMSARFRSGSQSLFGRSYHYAPEAVGVEGVPLQVWSTKSFEGALQANSPPNLFQADLRATGEGLTGTIKNNLPINLVDSVLIYRGEVYDVGTAGMLGAGDQYRFTEPKKRKIDQWVTAEFARPGTKTGSSSKPFGPGTSGSPVATPIKSILFFNRSAGSQYSNSGLRYLDQLWRTRLDHKEEAILVARTSPIEGIGPAEKISQSPVSPSHIWLGQLPGSGAKRPDLTGALTQETYVRVYVPVKP
jgi:hypothetical protein